MSDDGDDAPDVLEAQGNAEFIVDDDAEEPDGLFSGGFGDDRPGVPAGEGETWGEAAARRRREEAQELRRVCREWAEERLGNADAGDAVAERIVEETDHLDPDAWEAAVAEADTPEGDCPADGCPGTLRFARRKPSVIEYDCDTCDTTVPHYPEGQP